MTPVVESSVSGEWEIGKGEAASESPALECVAKTVGLAI